MVMIGASATAGFTMFEPFGGTNTEKLRLNHFLDAALAAPHGPIRNFASARFFIRPEVMGREQIEQATNAQPSVLIGADFLFWYCYGEGATDEDRLGRFEQGLKLLEAIRCPLVLGDLPDASAAVGIMLTEDQVPSARARAAANRRLKEWAAARPHVVVVPLSNFMHAAMGNEALTLHRKVIEAGQTRALLQFDKLHPSAQGCATLALAIVEALQQAHPAQFAGEVRWEAAEVMRLALVSAISRGSSPAPVPVEK
jgi:hypothetical protein